MYTATRVASTMAQRDATVNLRVTEDRKERWTDAVEERGVSSLADLIRLSVENELEGRHDSRRAEQAPDAPDLTAVGDRFDALESRMAATAERLDDVADAVADLTESSAGDGGETTEDTSADRATVTQTDVFEALPPKADIFTPEKVGEDEWTTEDNLTAAATAADVAEDLDAPVDAVDRVLRQLNLRTERVQYGEKDGVRFYYKDV